MIENGVTLQELPDKSQRLRKKLERILLLQNEKKENKKLKSFQELLE